MVAVRIQRAREAVVDIMQRDIVVARDYDVGRRKLVQEAACFGEL